MKFDMMGALDKLAEAFPGEGVSLQLDFDFRHTPAAARMLTLTAGRHHYRLGIRQPCVPDAAVCARLNADFQQAIEALKLEKETPLARFVREVKALVGPCHEVSITEQAPSPLVRLSVGGVNLGLFDTTKDLGLNLSLVLAALSAYGQRLTPEARPCKPL